MATHHMIILAIAIWLVTVLILLPGYLLLNPPPRSRDRNTCDCDEGGES